MKYILPLVMSLLLSSVTPAFAATQIYTVPSPGCVVVNANQPCVQNITPTTGQTISTNPTSGSSNTSPSTNPSSGQTISSAPAGNTANPSPSTAPCSTSGSAVSGSSSSISSQSTNDISAMHWGHHGKWHRAGRQGFLQWLIQWLIQLLQKLGINIPNLTPCGSSSGTPSTAPSSAVGGGNGNGSGGSNGGGSTSGTPSTATAPSTTNPTGSSGGTTTSSAPAPSSTTSNVQPVGISGSWTLAFDDEFNGSSLDTSKWKAIGDGGESMENNVSIDPANVSVSGGDLILTLSSQSVGANVTSDPNEVGSGKGFQFGDGYYLEGRIYFPGQSATNLYNWPAFWTSGNNWPATGEIDIAEVGNGPLTTSYHCSSGSGSDCGTATPGGSWGNGWHTYGVDRESGTNTIYWDGKQVASFTSSDGGANEYFLINVGNSTGSQCNCGGPSIYGTGSEVKVDYVRAWKKG